MNCFYFPVLYQKLHCSRIHNRICHLTKRHWKTFSTSLKNNWKENRSIPSCVGSSWLSAAKSKCKTTEEIIPQIVEQLEAKAGFFQRVEEALKDLCHLYPNVNIIVFGSAASNLAFLKSDVDLFMDFNIDGNNSAVNMIWSVKRTLLESGLFVRAEAISASVPIVKCVHRNQISCDISFSSRISIYDSRLINFLISTDDRLRPLMLILKYLLKKDDTVYNNHSLIVMIIFFLQRLENPLIPPISYLQSKARRRRMCNGWDVSFSHDISEWQKNKNNLTVIELLHKFFQFYSTFEFGLNVISVFTANSYLKPVFADENLLPAEYNLYKKIVSTNKSLRFDCNFFMCIQGVFNHSANISRNISPHAVNGFQRYCTTFATIGDELLHENSSEEDKFNFLVKLFEENDETTPTGKMRRGYMGTGEREVLFTMNNVCLSDAHLSADELRNKWWNSEFDKIVEIIRDVLKSEISIKSGELESKSDRVVEERIISCEMEYWEHLFKSRNDVQNEIDFPQGISIIEKEKIITKHIVGRLSKLEKPFTFDVVCLFEKNPTSIRLKIEPKALDRKSENFFGHLSSIFKRRIPQWLSSTRQIKAEFQQ